nr:FG-GAP-like repeat-containing protein [Acidovorax sp. D4N7]
MAFLVVHAQTTVPVKLAGDFSVSSSGAAVYRIPIQLPPGIAGTQPKLALLYNSQAGNGIMGMGWSVEGLSAITRCAKSMATDGTPGAITHSQEDRFCMDGQRLINIAGGYGAADSEYRTEIDGFSKIVAKGAAERNASNGPQVFIVKTKDGLTLEYGSTDDSRIEVRDGHVVRMWALSNVIDVKGNWTNYAYSKDHVNGEFNISSISYGGDRKVIFEYESRPDILNAFEAGSKIRQSVRLARIKTYLADKEQQSLAVTYSEESSGFASLPKAIKRCSSQECTFDTSLEWTSAGSPNFSGQMWSGHSGGQANNALGDFNGDGITDMIGDTGGGGIWHVCLSTTSGFNCESWSSHQGGRDNNVFGDFNGDGLTDMMAHTGEGGSWHVCLSTGSGFSCSYWSGHGGGPHNNVVGDFNGDGRDDMAGYTAEGGRWHVCLSTGSDFSCSYWNGHAEGRAKTVLGDFNGDGLTDMAGGPDLNGIVRVCLSTGVDFSCSPWVVGGDTPLSSGDFNGDGRTDFIRDIPDAGAWMVCLSTGVGFDCSSTWWKGHRGGADNNAVGDFNGDGRTDIAGYTGSGGIWDVCLSTGTSFDCAPWTGHSGGPGNYAVGDFNGDGRSDMAGYAGDGSWHITLSQSNATRSLSRISQGAHFISIHAQSQASLAANGGYFRDSGTAYPLSDARGALAMVKQVDISDAKGGANRTTYQYGGLKVEHASGQHPGSGRGMLGFRWMKSVLESTGVQTCSEFFQTWPHTGQVRTTETRLIKHGPHRLIKRSDNTLGCYQSEGMAGGVKPDSAMTACGEWAAGKVHFPFVASTTENSWELDGAQMPTLFTSSSYGGYPDQNGAVRQFGDPTQITVDIREGAGVKHRKLTTNEYQPARTDGPAWMIGRLRRATVTSSQPF